MNLRVSSSVDQIACSMPAALAARAILPACSSSVSAEKLSQKLARQKAPCAPSKAARTRASSLAPSTVVAARFLPVWLATGVLAIAAAIIATRALQNASWAYVLPYMTILAIAALGQMLVIMHAGIDLSTPGVISFGGNLIVCVSLGQDHRLALGIL